MLTYLKALLKLLLIPTLYIGGLFTMLVTVFKDAKWGLFLLIILIPQPNVWYKFFELPMGRDFLDMLYFSIILGLLFQHKGFSKTPNSLLIIMFILLSYVSLWNCSINFSLPLPISGDNAFLFDWKNYAQMIFLYFLSLNVLKKEEDQKTALLLMAIIILLISVRSYRNFSGGASFDYDKRVGGPFEAVGLGPNHFGAFIACYSAMLVALYFFEVKKLKKLLYIAASAFSLHPLLYSYSRGAYLAFISAISLFGLLKKRSLLILVIAVAITWQTLLPESVVDRIMMTTESETGQLEGSAAHRLDLWTHALDLFKSNPVFGVGFGGFGFTVPKGELTDTHNFYLKTLAEQGLIGFVVLLIVFLKSFKTGLRLYKSGRSDFHRGLGFGFMGTALAMVITNLFGDRWSYFVLGSYFWILWGLADRALLMQPAPTKATERATKSFAETLEEKSLSV
jgi:putative inorganic carbon (HCO3(-)) transporter